MAMARASSGLQYPERFYAAASYAGFDGSPRSSSKAVRSKFNSESALILYALYQQATVGPCNTPEPSAWNAVEKSKWSSWKKLADMASTEAMRLFVKILEEEDPGWYSRASNFVSDPVVDVQMNQSSNVHPVVENGNSFPETKTISTENGSIVEAQDKDVVSEGFGSIGVYDQWIAPPISGHRPKSRYEHGAAVIQDKMYIYGGNHNGRYLNDLHAFDLRSWSWSKIEAKAGAESLESPSPVTVTARAGHSLISWENKLISIAAATGGVVTADTFNTGLQIPAENDFHMEQDNIHEEVPHILGDNMPFRRNGSEVEEFNQPKELPECSLFNADDLGMEPPYTLDQSNGDDGNMCTKFEGNQTFNSSVSENGASFHNLEYSSPLPGMPIWRTGAEPAMPVDVDVGLGENDLCTSDTFQLPDDIDANNTRTSEYDVQLGMEVKADMPCGDFKSAAAPASTEGYLAELSNSLLNFTNEELMLMTADGKDVIDKSYYDGLSSLLLSSPNDDARQEQTIDITEPETSVAPVMYSMNPSSSDPGVVDDTKGSQNADEHMACHSETLMQSSSTASNYQYPELKDGVICCTLNTEDLEIPCNDDVFLPNHVLQSSTFSEVEWDLQEVNKLISSSSNDLPVNQRNSDTGPCFMRTEKKKPGEPHRSSPIKGSHHLQEMDPKPPLDNFGVKFELSKTDPSEVASKNPGHVSEGLGQIYSANPNTNTNPVPGILETRQSILAKRLSYNSTELRMEKPDLDYNSFKSYPQTNGRVSKQELDPTAASRDHKTLHAEVMPEYNAVSEPELSPWTSDQPGIFESDDDVPCYSDIEAMILDMDLDPDDQDLYSREEVSRYQHEDTKRRIIRLEQGAYSYLQRAIASHGAFAILYGRHSKHYIKKPEVLLGRATEDAIVDIDLGREGRGNKISRQQAMIKMDKGGSFYLKNLGKCSISVNSKEVAPGQSLSLSSSCLIEIRGMPFIFETNQTRVKQYMDSMTKVSSKQE